MNDSWGRSDEWRVVEGENSRLMMDGRRARKGVVLLLSDYCARDDLRRSRNRGVSDLGDWDDLARLDDQWRSWHLLLLNQNSCRLNLNRSWLSKLAGVVVQRSRGYCGVVSRRSGLDETRRKSSDSTAEGALLEA